jgi:hypothetical protein
MKVKLWGVRGSLPTPITAEMVENKIKKVLSLARPGDIASMEEVYTLNDTGAFIWQALDGTCTLAEIAKQLEQTYDALSAAIDSDLLDIMSGLKESGLITECPALKQVG